MNSNFVNRKEFNEDKNSIQNHKIYIPKQSFFNKILLTVKSVDNLIYQMYSEILGNLDTAINDLEIPKFFKNLLHSRQILFIFIFLSNFLMIKQNIRINLFEVTESNHNETITENNRNLYIFKSLLYYFSLSTFAISVCIILYLKFGNFSKMIIKHYPELDNYVLSLSPELKNNMCYTCKVVKSMRSSHCFYCDKCVTKFEFHSNWFNKCIGSQNLLIYTITLIFLNLFFISCLLSYFFQLFMIDKSSYLFDFKHNLFNLNFWFMLMIILQMKLSLFTSEFIKRSVFRNLTQNEKINLIRLTYLWKNARKEFFNPFDRGCWGNIKEVFVSFWNKNIDMIEDNDIIQKNLKTETVINVKDNKLNFNSSISNEDDFIFFNNENEEKKEENIKLDAEIKNKNNSCTTFTTIDKNVYYCPYNPESDLKVINWNRIRLYSIMDVINSPFRKIILKTLRPKHEF